MNIKIFFVKNYKEYFSNTEGIFQALKFKPLGKLSDFKIPDSLYRKVVKTNHQKYNSNLAELYETNLYGETGIDGIKIDFNFGLRLDIPEGNFFVRISDFDSGQIFFAENISDTRLISSENYFIHWQIEIYLDGEKIFEHIFEPEGQEILMAVPTNVLGDTLAILPYVREFQKLHNCKVFLYLPEFLRELAANFYPEIEQVHEITQNYYATFYLSGALGDCLTLPVDSRILPLEKVGGLILGIKNTPQLPKFIPTKKREIAEPYVCISVQASGVQKTWLYPDGWNIVVKYLKNLGYKVLCIDKNKIESDKDYTMQKPDQAEDFTGNISLIDRANMIHYADFFIGLGSGLSWLAHYVNCPVVMICGFSQDWYEFFTPYRVKNKFVCNGCYNDVQSSFLKNETCYKYKGTPRELECQKKISPQQVIKAIEKLLEDKNEHKNFLRQGF